MNIITYLKLAFVCGSARVNDGFRGNSLNYFFLFNYVLIKMKQTLNVKSSQPQCIIENLNFMLIGFL